MTQYEHQTPEWNCMFCAIVQGSAQTPGIFREDENFMAFLTKYPSTPWNTVVIPKQHFGSDVLAMPDQILQQFIIAAKKVANILENFYPQVGRIGLIMEWTGINHAHIKLIPMHDTWHMKQWIRKQYLSDREDYFTQYPWYLISTDWPEADHDELAQLVAQLRESY